jgi:hypothetical protein
MSISKLAIDMCTFNGEKNLCSLIQSFIFSTSSVGNTLTSFCWLKSDQVFCMFLGIFLGIAVYSQAKMDSRNGNVSYIKESMDDIKISTQAPSISQV